MAIPPANKRNPLSSSRRSYLAKYVFNNLIKSAMMELQIEDDPSYKQRLKILKKIKVGPFKLILWKEENMLLAFKELSSPYLMTGHEIIRIPKQDEDKVEQLWEKYQATAQKILDHNHQITQTLLDKLAEADPTESGEYAAWIAKQSFAGNLHINVEDDEDIEKVNQDLMVFEIRKRRNIIPVELRDINKFATYADLFETLRQYGGLVEDKEALQLALQGSNIVHQSTIWQVIQIKNWKLAKRLAQGTAWCIRGTDMARRYLRKPEEYPLYLFVKNGEKFALLTNLPDSQQFQDVKDQSISEQTIRKEPELLELVEEFSDWIYCSECRRFYWGDKESDDSLNRRELLHSLRESRDIRLAGAMGGAWLIGEIPSPFWNDPNVVAKPELLKNRIVIGPSRQVLAQEGIQLPDIDEFAKKAGYSAEIYADALLKLDRCDKCNSVKNEDELVNNAIHALYVLATCEDYPCCNHEPLAMGAPGCPPMDLEGQQVGMRCVCAAFVPLSSNVSICPACLDAAHREAGDEDMYEMAEGMDEEEELDDEDGCPVENMEILLTNLLDKWGEQVNQDWGERTGRHIGDAGEWYPGPRWNDFEDLVKRLRHREVFSSEVRKFIKKECRLLLEVEEDGAFDRSFLKHTMIPMLQKLRRLVEDNNKTTHVDCCGEEVD